MARNPAAAEPSNEKLRNDAFVLMFDDEGFVVRNQTLQAEGILHERDFNCLVHRETSSRQAPRCAFGLPQGLILAQR